MKQLSELKREMNPEEGELQTWDMMYYMREYKARFAGIDDAVLRQYFPLEHVKQTILSIYEKLLGLKFMQEKDVEVWHDDVECYSVFDAATDELQGYFYLDLFPRPGKYSHQCVYPLRPSYILENGERVLPACVNLGNLTAPRPGSPSLLLFREVETFFHEFGHVMHCVLTNSKHSLHAFSWSAVPWPGGVEQDFLEIPSMMLENFVWQPEVLKLLSHNIADGSRLPDATIKALNESRSLMTGYTKTKYLAMAMYDLHVHCSASAPYRLDGECHDVTSLFNVMMKKYTGIDQIRGSFAGASWLHLMQG
jgi:thimet oligopeptidase